MIVMTSGTDLLLDFSHGVDLKHVMTEIVIVCLSSTAIALVLFEIYRQKLEIKSLQKQLQESDTSKAAPKQYILDARKNLSHVISQQFTEWLLTDSEIEVAWLLLKGLSSKEIAVIRNTQEKTVRQQASAIYKKSGINGRHAFSAWFIEDML